VIAILAVGVAACGGGTEASATANGTIGCLRGLGADALRPRSNTYLGNVLPGLAALNTADLIMVRLPSGAITTLGFLRRKPVAASVLNYVEHRGEVLIAWRKPPTKNDDHQLTDCLVARSDAAPKEPAKPLGCAGVFFREGATATQVAPVRSSLERSRFVRSVRAVSKEKALQYYRQRYPELTNSLAAGPLPDTLYVTPRQGSDLESIQAELRRFGDAVGYLQLDAAPCPR
jgi:hypothetical protein